MHRARIFFAVCVSLILSVSVRFSFADSQTFNSVFFEPATGKNKYFMLQGTETLHKFQVNTGLFFSYSYHPLDIRDGGARIRGIINQLVVADFVAAFGITEWLDMGLDLPVVIVNQFADPLIAGSPPSSNQFNVGDLRFEIKARVLDSCRWPVGLAFVPFITAPTGSASHYVGDPSLTGGVKIALDGRVHEKIGLTLNVGYQGGKKIKLQNIEYQNRLLLGAGVWGMFSHGISVFGEVDAKAAFNKLFKDRDMNPADFFAGINWDVKETGLTVSGGGGTCLVCGVGGARVVGVLAAKYRYNPEKFKKLDRGEGLMCKGKFEKGLSADDLKKLKTACPVDPADYKPGIDDAACPKYYEIKDLADLVLRCPSVPEDFNPKYHDAACPKVFNLAETYSADEIRSIYTLSAAEMSILCPPDPKDFNPQLHDVGCPKYYDLKEMVALSKECPPSASEYREGVDDPSCPKFYTLRDTYPAEQWREVELAVKKDAGIFGASAQEIVGGEIQTLRPVYFAFGSARLKPQSVEAIDEVISVVNKTPWIKRVRVGGHADSIGSPDANERLSRRRADVVIAYMKAHGLNEGVDLIPIAYGSSRPTAPNRTEAGRAENRRVAFVVIGAAQTSK